MMPSMWIKGSSSRGAFEPLSKAVVKHRRSGDTKIKVVDTPADEDRHQVHEEGSRQERGVGAKDIYRRSAGGSTDRSERPSSQSAFSSTKTVLFRAG